MRDPQEIIGTKTPETAPLRTSFSKSSFASPMDGSWAISRPAPDQVVFRAENDQVAVEKRYKLVDRFQLSLEVVVENRAAPRPRRRWRCICTTGRTRPGWAAASGRQLGQTGRRWCAPLTTTTSSAC
jgi:hypothetical protein